MPWRWPSPLAPYDIELDRARPGTPRDTDYICEDRGGRGKGRTEGSALLVLGDEGQPQD
jgi:hypothetical protein